VRTIASQHAIIFRIDSKMLKSFISQFLFQNFLFFHFQV